MALIERQKSPGSQSAVQICVSETLLVVEKNENQTAFTCFQIVFQILLFTISLLNSKYLNNDSYFYTLYFLCIFTF